MCHVTAGKGTYLARREGCYCDGFASEGHEFDFVGRSALMDVYYGANITRLEIFTRHVRS